MVGISSAGIGSGLDIEGIIGSLMAAERLPLNKVSQERTAINTKISIYGIIKNSFADLKSAADKLTNLSNLNPLKATSSDDKWCQPPPALPTQRALTALKSASWPRPKAWPPLLWPLPTALWVPAA